MKEQLKAVSPNTRYLLILLLSLSVSILIYMQFILPLGLDKQKLDNDLLQMNTKLALVQTFAGQNQNYENSLHIRTLQLEVSKRKLPDTVTVPELVTEYDTLAQANGITLDSLKPPNEAKTDKSSMYAIPVKLTLSGDYFNLIRFLQQVETGERFTTIQGVDFTSDDKGILKMNADFVVYAFKNPNPPAKKAAQNAETKNNNNAEPKK